MEQSVEPHDDGYQVKLEVFEGPLDLLLHLIRINKIDICNIPIVQITDQYNQYLDLMREMNFDIAGEFLVMAATLMYIKSKMLLPAETFPGTGETEDPRTDLTRQLIDYQRYKLASENLTALEDIQSLIRIREAGEIVSIEGEEFIEASIFDLVKAFKAIIDKAEGKKRVEISREEFSVQEKMSFILEMLKRSSSLSFESLFSLSSPRGEKIAIFLAVLELIRLKKIKALQRSAEDSIRIFRSPEKRKPAENGRRGNEEEIKSA